MVKIDLSDKPSIILFIFYKCCFYFFLMRLYQKYHISPFHHSRNYSLSYPIEMLKCVYEKDMEMVGLSKNNPTLHHFPSSFRQGAFFTIPPYPDKKTYKGYISFSYHAAYRGLQSTILW